MLLRQKTQHWSVDPATVEIPQNSVSHITRIWAAVVVTTATAAWVVARLLAEAFHDPTAFPRALIASLTAAMVWQLLVGGRRGSGDVGN